jgi:hypothetical protein
MQNDQLNSAICEWQNGCLTYYWWNIMQWTCVEICTDFKLIWSVFRFIRKPIGLMAMRCINQFKAKLTTLVHCRAKAQPSVDSQEKIALCRKEIRLILFLHMRHQTKRFFVSRTEYVLPEGSQDENNYCLSQFSQIWSRKQRRQWDPADHQQFLICINNLRFCLIQELV